MDPSSGIDRSKEIPLRIEFCAGCGAPLEARWNRIVIVCRHCGSQNAPGQKGDPVPSSTPDDGRLRLAIDGRTYLILGKLATGDSTDVFLGRWVQRLGEQVVIKVLRSASDRDLLVREHAFLRRLHESPLPGTSHFAGLIPEPVACGPARVGASERFLMVLRWRSGFLHTVEDVMRYYTQGVDPHVAAWVFKRVLEILHWSHQSGVLHGAVLPPHILIHPRDHGAMLIGWSSAVGATTVGTQRIPAVSRAWKSWYPAGSSASPANDVAMAARSVLAMAGASTFDSGGTLPGPISSLMIQAAGGAFSDALALRTLLSERIVEVFGPPQWHPLWMPGWPALPTP
jgi:serine/threonine protein kinase